MKAMTCQWCGLHAATNSHLAHCQAAPQVEQYKAKEKLETARLNRRLSKGRKSGDR